MEVVSNPIWVEQYASEKEARDAETQYQLRGDPVRVEFRKLW